jgi:hypothetical protein
VRRLPFNTPVDVEYLMDVPVLVDADDCRLDQGFFHGDAKMKAAARAINSYAETPTCAELCRAFRSSPWAQVYIRECFKAARKRARRKT